MMHHKLKIGIQTTEINYYNTLKNDCYADEATQRAKEILGDIGSKVILRSKNPSRRDRFGRLYRYVLKQEGNKEIDLGKVLLAEGLALPMEIEDETTFSDLYNSLAQEAKLDKKGLWSTIDGPNHCPTTADSEGAKFEINLHYFTRGEDNQNLSDEWLRIKNISGRSVDISHWWLRDSALNFFRFPESTVIENNEEVIIIGGQGQNSNNIFYWGNTESIFNDNNDGVYLLDYLEYDTNDTNSSYSPKGNLKAAFIYPCVGDNCIDNLQGKIKIVAHYDAIGDDAQNVNGEWIRITNLSQSDINLKNHLLFYDALGTQHYTFKEDTILHANEELYIYAGQGSDTRLVKYLNKSSPVLANSGGRVWLTAFDANIVVADFSWPCENNCADSLDGKLEVRVNYDAIGDDLVNPNGEWISLVNTSKEDINLKDYLLHYDIHGSQHYYFREETILHSNESLYLYMGEGNETRLVKYAGRTSGILANNGGKAWLTNLKGTTVAEFSWPCTVDCQYDAPLEIINVNYDAQGDDLSNPNGEWIDIKNSSGTYIDLRNWELKVRGYQYHFLESTILNPGQQIRIYMGTGTKQKAKKYYWGFSEGKLYNSGDIVELYNPQRILSYCYSWGDKQDSCSLDSDNDGIANVEDDDDDGDGVIDSLDDFPLYKNESKDTDKDGIGNNTDKDDDGDGYSDEEEEALGSDPLDNTSIPKKKSNAYIPIVIIYML